MTPKSILDFWFEEAGPELWFVKDPAFDAWRETAEGALALCILLDQAPRNLFRDHARAFASDQAALAVARDAIARGYDEAPGISETQRSFFYMPFMHSESLTDQEHCVALFEKSGNADNHAYAVRHRDIIARSGRFSHRNDVLGRDSSDAELAFLNEPDSSF